MKTSAILLGLSIWMMGLGVSVHAAPPASCTPWPDCKNDPGGSPTQSTCSDVFFAGTSGICMKTCYFDGTCGGEDPECGLVGHEDNTPGWKLNDHCATTKTLVVPQETPFFGVESDFSLTLIAGLSGVWEGGRAGIMNELGGVRVTGMTIIVDGAGVANGSCPGTLDDTLATTHGTVVAAVTINPYRNGPTLPRPAAGGLTVRAINGARLCNGLEFGGGSVDSLRADDTGYRASVGLASNVIEADTYTQYGLVFQYMDFRDDADEGVVVDNTVGPSPGGCAAIKVGPLVERMEISGNTVSAPTGCGIGIDIESTGVAFDDGLGHVLEDERPIVIVDNHVDTASAGAMTALRIQDSAVGKNEANSITCDAGDVTYDVAGTSGLSFPSNGKKINTANGMTIETANEACPGP